MASRLRATPGRLAVILFFASHASAQTPPDFSGKWTIVPEATPSGTAMGSAPPTLSAQGNMGSGWPADIQFTQDASTLTLQYTYFHPREVQPPFVLKYALDGSQSRNTLNLGRGPQDQVSKTSMEGNSLVITTTHAFTNPLNGQAMTSETRQVLTLSSPDQLVIETTRSAVMGGKASTTRTIYSRKN